MQKPKIPIRKQIYDLIGIKNVTCQESLLLSACDDYYAFQTIIPLTFLNEFEIVDDGLDNTIDAAIEILNMLLINDKKTLSKIYILENHSWWKNEKRKGVDSLIDLLVAFGFISYSNLSRKSSKTCFSISLSGERFIYTHNLMKASNDEEKSQWVSKIIVM